MADRAAGPLRAHRVVVATVLVCNGEAAVDRQCATAHVFAVKGLAGRDRVAALQARDRHRLAGDVRAVVLAAIGDRRQRQLRFVYRERTVVLGHTGVVRLDLRGVAQRVGVRARVATCHAGAGTTVVGHVIAQQTRGHQTADRLVAPVVRHRTAVGRQHHVGTGVRRDFQRIARLTSGGERKAHRAQPRVIQGQGVCLHGLISTALDVTNRLTGRIQGDLINHVGFGNGEVVGSTGRHESATVAGVRLHLCLDVGKVIVRLHRVPVVFTLQCNAGQGAGQLGRCRLAEQHLILRTIGDAAALNLVERRIQSVAGPCIKQGVERCINVHQITRTRRRSCVDAHGSIAVGHRSPGSGLYISTAARARCAGHPSAQRHGAAAAVGDGLVERQISRGRHHFDAVLGNHAIDANGGADHQRLCVFEIQRFHLRRQGIDLM